MKLTAKILFLLSITVAVSGLPTQVSMASTIPNKTVNVKAPKKVIDIIPPSKTTNHTAVIAQAKVTAQTVLEENKQSAEMQGSINSYNQLLSHLNTKITADKKQLISTQRQIKTLNESIAQNTIALNEAQQNLANVLRIMYEDGQVSYLEVLFQATSFSDFLDRFELLRTITAYESQAMQNVSNLTKTLDAQKAAQAKAVQQLQVQVAADQSLQKIDQSIQDEQKTILDNVKNQLKSNSAKLSHLETQLSPSELADLESQIQQVNSILSTNVPDVTVDSLRYQNIDPKILFDYVQGQGSTFSLQDIETICAAAKTYDVNPALMVAITGQEQSFVPAGPDAAKIRNNPFNVYYSWQVYNTTLADAANIAADTLRHKLSVPPPPGDNPILWINDPANPWGIYATDTHWAYGVDQIYTAIMKYVDATATPVSKDSTQAAK